MDKVLFEDLKNIFNAGTVFQNDNIKYWYEHVWKILDDFGMTTYKSQLEKITIYMKALALVFVYFSFCNECYGEFFDPYYLYEIINYEISDIEIVVCASAYVEDEEWDDNLEEAVYRIVLKLSYDLFQVLKKQLCADEVYTWMFCGGTTLYQKDDKPNGENNIYSINCYDDYKKMVEENWERMYIESDSAFYYLCDLMM